VTRPAKAVLILWPLFGSDEINCIRGAGMIGCRFLFAAAPGVALIAVPMFAMLLMPAWAMMFDLWSRIGGGHRLGC